MSFLFFFSSFFFRVCAESVGAFTAFGRSLTFVFDYYCYYETANQPTNIVCVVSCRLLVCLRRLRCVVSSSFWGTPPLCMLNNQTGRPASQPSSHYYYHHLCCVLYYYYYNCYCQQLVCLNLGFLFPIQEITNQTGNYNDNNNNNNNGNDFFICVLYSLCRGFFLFFFLPVL